MVPVNKQQPYLRPLATINQVNKCISIFKGKQEKLKDLCGVEGSRI